MTSDALLDAAFSDVDARIAAIEAWPEGAEKDEARALAGALLEIHRRGLARLLRAAGPEAAARIAADPGVASLLVLHGVHPSSFEERARAAVDRAQGAYPDLGIVAIAGARLVVEVGARGGASSASVAIERALLEQLPDAEAIEVRAPAPALVQIRRARVASP